MNKQLNKLVMTSMLMALTCVATMVIKVPTVGTNGYVNIGDVMVLVSAIFLQNPYGALAAGLGSGLADLLSGYGSYVPGTFVIKYCMAFVCAIVYSKLRERNVSSFISFIISGILAEVIMVGGYFLYESIFLGYGLAAALSIPSNMIQGATCLVIAYVLVPILSRMRINKLALES